MWPLDPFTRENGGTRLWPGRHLDPDIPGMDEDEAIVPRLSPGDALLFLGSTLHGGGGNFSRAPRRGIVVSHCPGWLNPSHMPRVVFPPVHPPRFRPDLAALVGHPPPPRHSLQGRGRGDRAPPVPRRCLAVPRLHAPRGWRKRQPGAPARDRRQLLPRLAQALRAAVACLSAGYRAPLRAGSGGAGRLRPAPDEPRKCRGTMPFGPAA